MIHSHDNITVGFITLVYSEVHHGWITPYNEVIKNPFIAQRTASQAGSGRERNSRLKNETLRCWLFASRVETAS